MQRSLLLLIVSCAVAAPRAHADTARVVVVGGELRFNRVLPAGKEFTVELPAPGTDEIAGTLEIWPLEDGADDCDVAPPFGDKQFHKLGLTTSNTGDNRVLSATVPALQIQQGYCLRLEIERALREDQIAAVAEAVGDRAARRFDWEHRCRESHIEDKVTDFVEAEMSERLGVLLADVPALAAGAPAAAAPYPGDLRQAAQRVVSLAKVRELCTSVSDNANAIKQAAAHERAADADATNANDALRALAGTPTPVQAWPAAIPESAAPFSAAPLISHLSDPPATLARIAANLSSTDPALADAVRDLTTLSDEPLAAAVKALQARLKTPPRARPLTLFVPSHHRFLPAVTFMDPDVFDEVLRDIVNTQLLDTQLRLIGDQNPRDLTVAQRWLAAIRRVRDTQTEASARAAAVSKLERERDQLVTSIRAALVEAVKRESVRRLLRQSTTVTTPSLTGKPGSTDEKASWVSPTLGVAVAVPWVRDAQEQGFADPWLVPYAGVNIYFRRVDRVIDPGDLVGCDTFWQKNSLQVGLWLKKPRLREEQISGMWDSGPVPFLAVGHRFTPYIRVDVGVSFYEHTRRLPTTTDKAFGFAPWIGASIDADVWAAANGKLTGG